MKLTLIDQIKATNPVVLNIANMVTPTDVANGLNVLGASPIMSTASEEASDLVKIAQAVTINIGTVNANSFKQMQAVLMAANGKVPLVLDPVACGASRYRSQVVSQLLADYQFTVIRGNAGEIAHLAGADWQGHGIDAGDGNGDVTAIAKACARKYHCITVLTGATDIITDGDEVNKVPFGTPLFAVHVGTGDMLSSMIGAFCAIEPNTLEAASTACLTFALCGQAAAKTATAPNAWYDALLNQLYTLNHATAQHLQTTLKEAFHA
ncbi:MAG: hydroxyethylthiazole kinase [Lactobacillus sp.]